MKKKQGLIRSRALEKGNGSFLDFIGEEIDGLFVDQTIFYGKKNSLFFFGKPPSATWFAVDDEGKAVGDGNESLFLSQFVDDFSLFLEILCGMDAY